LVASRAAIARRTLFAGWSNLKYTPNGNKAASLVSAAMRFVTNKNKGPAGGRALSPRVRLAEIYGSPKSSLYFCYLRNVDSRRWLFLNTLRASESRSYDFNTPRAVLASLEACLELISPIFSPARHATELHLCCSHRRISREIWFS